MVLRARSQLIDYPETLKVIIDDGDRLDEVGKLIAVWDKFTENKPFKLNPDHAFITTLAEGELENMKNYGLKYCPCRITVGDAEKDLDLICPCNFFKQPVYKESGECWRAGAVREKVIRWSTQVIDCYSFLEKNAHIVEGYAPL